MEAAHTHRKIAVDPLLFHSSAIYTTAMAISIFSAELVHGLHLQVYTPENVP